MPAVQSVAFYLPQFHPIPENDSWWGEGFTDWVNVRRAIPRFSGHYQPHVPGSLGYYDLRDPNVRDAQTRIASMYGVTAFCYYHYWFEGRRLLNTPFDEVLESGSPDFPFALCWANENWTRSWDGNKRHVLLNQRYSADDDANHVKWLRRAWSDHRYLRVDDRPLFLIYRSHDLPSEAATVSRWRALARSAGVGELFLCRVDSFQQPRSDPRRAGFDAAVEFHPTRAILRPRIWRRAARKLVGPRGRLRDVVIDYAEYARRAMTLPTPHYPRFPCVVPSWDNSARRPHDATILRDSTPAAFERWMEQAVMEASKPSAPAPLLFVNAWNEWAEGNHLEPCVRWGFDYLEAHRRALLSH